MTIRSLSVVIVLILNYLNVQTANATSVWAEASASATNGESVSSSAWSEIDTDESTPDESRSFDNRTFSLIPSLFEPSREPTLILLQRSDATSDRVEEYQKSETALDNIRHQQFAPSRRVTKTTTASSSMEETSKSEQVETPTAKPADSMADKTPQTPNSSEIPTAITQAVNGLTIPVVYSISPARAAVPKYFTVAVFGILTMLVLDTMLILSLFVIKPLTPRPQNTPRF